MERQIDGGDHGSRQRGQDKSVAVPTFSIEASAQRVGGGAKR